MDSVAAVSWGRDRIDLFWVDAERALWHRSFAGSWSAPESLGGRLASPPAVTARAPQKEPIQIGPQIAPEPIRMTAAVTP